MFENSPLVEMPRRILLVLTEFPPAIGGMQTHARYLSEFLHDHGYEIEVHTYFPPSELERDQASTFDEKLPFPVHRDLSRIGYWHTVKLLQQAISRFRPQLVYSSTVFFGVLGKLSGVPVICRSVGNDVLRPWIAYPFHWGTKWLSHWRLERLLFDFFRRLETPDIVEMLFRKKRKELMSESAREARYILANSHFTQSLLEDEVGVEKGRIQVLIGGVDARRFHNRANPVHGVIRKTLGIPPDAFLLTTACRLVAKKGVDFLLRAFAEFAPLHSDWHLMIIGHGRKEKSLQTLATELGFHHRVTFTGPVPHDHIHSYYTASDVFVLASRVEENPRTGLRDAETMGRVLCEANAAGIPVVAARSGGIPSVVSHEQNGLLFEPDQSADLLRQLHRIRAEPQLVAKMVERGRTMAREQFDWSVVLSRHEELFGRLLQHSTQS